MPKYLTHKRCKVCGSRLYMTTLNERYYCKKCYKYLDEEEVGINDEIEDN